MGEEVDTRGMNADNYSPDNDPDGSIGHYLADRLYRSRDGRAKRKELEREVANQERGLPACGRPRKGSKEYWVGVARIALRKFPATLPDEWGEASPRELRRRLGQLRKAGYSVPRYSKMKAYELRRTYEGIRRKVAEEAARHCPEVLGEIEEGNREVAQREFEAR